MMMEIDTKVHSSWVLHTQSQAPLPFQTASAPPSIDELPPPSTNSPLSQPTASSLNKWPPPLINGPLPPSTNGEWPPPSLDKGQMASHFNELPPPSRNGSLPPSTKGEWPLPSINGLLPLTNGLLSTNSLLPPSKKWSPPLMNTFTITSMHGLLPFHFVVVAVWCVWWTGSHKYYCPSCTLGLSSMWLEIIEWHCFSGLWCRVWDTLCPYLDITYAHFWTWPKTDISHHSHARGHWLWDTSTLLLCNSFVIVDSAHLYVEFLSHRVARVSRKLLRMKEKSVGIQP